MAAEENKGSQYCQAGVIFVLVVAGIFGFLANEFIPKEALEASLKLDVPGSVLSGKSESPRGRRQQHSSLPQRPSTIQECEKILNEALREYYERHADEDDTQEEETVSNASSDFSSPGQSHFQQPKQRGVNPPEEPSEKTNPDDEEDHHSRQGNEPQPNAKPEQARNQPEPEVLKRPAETNSPVPTKSQSVSDAESSKRDTGKDSRTSQGREAERESRTPPGREAERESRTPQGRETEKEPRTPQGGIQKDERQKQEQVQPKQQEIPSKQAREQTSREQTSPGSKIPAAEVVQDEDEDASDDEDTPVAHESDDDEDDDIPEHRHLDDDSDEEPDTESDSGGAHLVQGLPPQKPSPDEPSAEEEEEETEEVAVGITEDQSQHSAQTAEDTDSEEDAQEEESAPPSHDKSGEHLVYRSRSHIAQVLGFKDIGSQQDKEEDVLIQEILQELKKISVATIQPMEKLFKFKDISQRVLGDAEIFNKPMALFLGPWSAGKSTIINYLLGIEGSPVALKTGPHPTDTDFTIIHHTDSPQKISGTEMAAHWAFYGVNKFGQGFLDHFRGIGFPHPLLQKVTIVDTPGILEHRKPTDYPFNDAFQWFIDRADAIYVVFDPSKLEIGSELEAILDQLKGREPQIRFLLNKADTIQRSDVMRVAGQLLWNVSPLLGSVDAPVIYSVSLTSRPFHPHAPADYLLDQEKSFLTDLRQVMDERIENTISFARRHAVRVRNHAKLVDCYLATYFKQKSLFSSKKKVADAIIQDPHKYNIFEGLSKLSNISRYDLPDPQAYFKFFRLNPLFDFKPLQATCTYFKGCPLDKLDIAIAYDLPQLLGKYNERTKKERYQEEKDR